MALYVLYSIVRSTIDVSANRERSDYFSSQKAEKGGIDVFVGNAKNETRETQMASGCRFPTHFFLLYEIFNKFPFFSVLIY